MNIIVQYYHKQKNKTKYEQKFGFYVEKQNLKENTPNQWLGEDCLLIDRRRDSAYKNIRIRFEEYGAAPIAVIEFAGVIKYNIEDKMKFFLYIILKNKIVKSRSLYECG